MWRSGRPRRAAARAATRARAAAVARPRPDRRTPCRPRPAVGHGQTVQLVVRSFTTLIPSRTVGSRSLPTSTGSRSAIRPGALGTGQRHARRAVIAQREDPLAVPRRYVLERLLARVFDPGALDVRVEPPDVDEPRAVPIRARRERAHEIFLARLAADRDDLVLLHVGAEADDQVGEAREGGVVHAGQGTERFATVVRPLGGVREWLNRAVSKTVVRATVPRVRIPPPPLITAVLRDIRLARPGCVPGTPCP